MPQCSQSHTNWHLVAPVAPVVGAVVVDGVQETASPNAPPVISVAVGGGAVSDLAAFWETLRLSRIAGGGAVVSPVRGCSIAAAVWATWTLCENAAAIPSAWW